MKDILIQANESSRALAPLAMLRGLLVPLGPFLSLPSHPQPSPLALLFLLAPVTLVFPKVPHLLAFHFLFLC